jgi:hypothetical protein
MATLNVFLREKINGLDTPEVIIETEKSYTIQNYDKRQLFVTGSRQTTIFEIGTVGSGTFNGDALTYGRITNKGSANVALTVTNTNSDEAHFLLGGGEHFFLSNDYFAETSGSWFDISSVKCQVDAGSSKVKIEYLLVADTIVA